MDASIKPKSTIPEKLDISTDFKGPANKSALSQIAFEHPLSQSEINYNKHKQNLNFRMLRNTEGLHAPLKLSMEIAAVKKVGRFPFLPSSNPHLDVLLGRDELIEFPDFLGTEEYSEVIRLPHAVMEKSLGIL